MRTFDDIEVKVLGTWLGEELFLGRLTQRGDEIRDMEDLMTLHNKSLLGKVPSADYMRLPHTTLRRMSFIEVAIVGLSTKCMNQLRTHATRLTFVSTSTQYSNYTGQDNFILPSGLSEEAADIMKEFYDNAQNVYNKLINEYGVDNDKASYVLPQSLRKVVIISGSLDAWEYVMRTRLCYRNSEEMQYVMKLIYKEFAKRMPPTYLVNMLPKCTTTGCEEGKFCCGKKFDEKECLR